MKTITLIEPGKLEFSDTGSPQTPGPGEALVRVRRIGVCGTDIHAHAGRQPFFSYPRILGHELGVEVLETGEGVERIQPGDKCSVEPYMNCGKCIACRRGKPNCCADIKVLGVHTDGGMREQIVVRADKLHASDNLDFDQLALVEPLAIGCHAVDRASLERGEFALVIGAGPIGLATIQFALEAGARVIVLDVNEARLAFCRDVLGVEFTIDATKQKTIDALLDITKGDLPTAVFDATGNPKSMADAFDYPAPGGRLVFVGLFQGDVTFNDPLFHKREMTLMGSRNARPQDFSRIIDLISMGRIDTKPWITHRAPFERAAQDFLCWTKPETGVIKAIIEL
ncbi:MAG: zinc-binding alcohol dehydrogenase family protein [bacterium]